MHIKFTIALLLPMFALTGVAYADDEPAQEPAEIKAAATQPEILCPVTNKPVDRDQVTRFRGKWVYFASKQARQKFEADPYSYVDGLRKQWEADKPLRVQVKCPVTGKVPSNEIYLGKGRDAIFFATPKARTAWEQQPEKYADHLAGCYTFQTGCAFCGGDIKPDATREYHGRTLYFCCQGCPTGFMKNPAFYLAKVDEQIASNKRAWEQRPQSNRPDKEEANAPETQASTGSPKREAE